MKIVVIRIDCLGQYFLTRAVAHVYLRQVFLTRRRERSAGYFNRLAGTCDLEFIDRRDRELCLGSLCPAAAETIKTSSTTESEVTFIQALLNRT